MLPKLDTTNAIFRKMAQANVWGVFVLALFISCSFISVITPPFQSPDEYDHIKRAYLLSNGAFVLDAPADQVESGGMVDVGLLTYMRLFTRYSYQKDEKLSIEEREVASSMQWSGAQQFSPAPGTGYYFPLIYSPQAMGLALGEAFGLSVDHSYRLARFLTLLALSLALLWSFRLYAPAALIPALLVVPMSLFQMSTASLDGLSTAIAILAVSALLRISIDRESSKRWLIFLLGACVFVVASSRVHLLPMVLLIFASYFYTKNKNSIVVGVAVTALTLAWLGFAISSTVDVRVSLGISTRELLLHYIVNPGQFIQVIANTFSDATMRTHWSESFLGVLGWLDTPFFPSVYVYLWGLLLLTLLFSLSFAGIRHNWPVRALLLVCSAGSLMMVFLALLITWTPHPATIVEGVQGRYFLLPGLFLAYALCFSSDVRAKHGSKVGSYDGSHTGSNANVAAGAGSRLIRPLLSVCGLVSLAALFAYSAFITSNRLLDRYYLPTASSHLVRVGSTASPSRIFGELTTGRVFEQTFVVKSDNILQVRLFLATFDRKNSGPIHLEIVDADNTPVFDHSIDSASVIDNTWLNISTGILPVNKGESYKLRLTTNAGAPGNAITWWASDVDSYHDGHAVVDSVEQAADFSFAIFSFPAP